MPVIYSNKQTLEETRAVEALTDSNAEDLYRHPKALTFKSGVAAEASADQANSDSAKTSR